MATFTRKSLGQQNPSANTDTTLYTVPAATDAIVSSIVVCNQAGTSATFRIAVRVAGAAIAAKHYLVYDAPIDANSTVTLRLGITMAATDVLTVRASTTSLSFNAFGQETA